MSLDEERESTEMPMTEDSGADEQEVADAQVALAVSHARESR